MFQEFTLKSEYDFSQNQRNLDDMELDVEKKSMFYGYYTESLFDDTPQLSDMKPSEETDLCFKRFYPTKSEDSISSVDGQDEAWYKRLPSLEQLMVDAVPLDDDILPTSNLLNLRGQLDHQYEQIKAFVTENECLADFDFTLFDNKIHSDQNETKPEISVDIAQKTTWISESEFKVPRRVKNNKRMNK
jgi:hypothetical protein